MLKKKIIEKNPAPKRKEKIEHGRKKQKKLEKMKKEKNIYIEKIQHMPSSLYLHYCTVHLNSGVRTFSQKMVTIELEEVVKNHPTFVDQEKNIYMCLMSGELRRQP